MRLKGNKQFMNSVKKGSQKVSERVFFIKDPLMQYFYCKRLTW